MSHMADNPEVVNVLTLVAGGTPYLSSPDTTSSIFPDRLIRPLPKRSLKSRLSQEAADSIEYPPTLPSSSLPVYSHYGEHGEYLNDSKVLVQNGDIYDDHDHYHDHDHCPHHHHCHHEDEEDEPDSAEDSSPAALRHPSLRSSPRSSRTARHTRYGSQAKGSVSGADGYEAFENTNNKKKRKIPTSGSLSLHHSSLTSDTNHLAISANGDATADEYYGQGGAQSSGLGVQGAGRGHYARRGGSRRPLGVSMNGSNIKSSKYDQNMTATAKAEDPKDQGIISAAIEHATALLRRPLGKGQENGGVLEQQAKQTSANSQFTFTCEAEAKGVTFPEQSLYSPGYSQRSSNLAPPVSGIHKVSNTQGTQTSPNMTTQGSQQGVASQQANANAQGKKPRRRRGDVYALAARQRKLQQEYANMQNPPVPDDIWICEFCEYESIFGQPPHALIRQYEIKDRKERRRLAEKRRLLEKAKLKGRKGKKQAKNAAKAANNVVHQNANQQAYDQQPLDQLGDDDLDYGHDDDPIPMPAPPSAPTKQPAPGSHDTTAGKGGGGTRDGSTR